VQFEVEGEPEVVGLCHCTDCRKETGSAFLAYADWPRSRFRLTKGEYATYAGRSFCAQCGSSLFHLSEEQAEICLGALDAAPNGLTPTREGWVVRREHWLPRIPGANQHFTDPVEHARKGARAG
jgi:hypothetical protein